jgi:FtsP/CotA-like multicopper oxidase with cupredoxin domain
LVNDAAEDALGLPGGSYEVPLVLRDTTLDRTGNMLYKPRSGGFEGEIPLVNGTRDPFLNVDSALYRFRLLGGSNARVFRLALGNAAPFVLIGNDGGLLKRSIGVTRIDVAPGERVDVLVDFRAASVGDSIMLRDTRGGVGSARVPGRAPGERSRHDPHRVVIDHGAHGAGEDEDLLVRRDEERGWKDTVLLNDRETVEVLIRFDAYRGLYLLHCHKLEHEDMGMMSNFEVA